MPFLGERGGRGGGEGRSARQQNPGPAGIADRRDASGVLISLDEVDVAGLPGVLSLLPLPAPSRASPARCVSP